MYTLEDILWIKHTIELAVAVIFAALALMFFFLYLRFPFSKKKLSQWKCKYDRVKASKKARKYIGYYMGFLWRIALPCIFSVFNMVGLLDFATWDLFHVCLLVVFTTLSVFTIRSTVILVRYIARRKS